MLYQLSKLLPVPMRTRYTEPQGNVNVPYDRRVAVSWWQWRGHVWAIRAWLIP